MEKEPSEPIAQTDDVLWEQLARHLAGESTPEESASVRAWLAADTARADEFNGLASMMSALPSQRYADVDVDNALARVRSQLQVLSFPRWRTPLLRAAAVVAVVLGASLIWRATGSRNPTQTTPHVAASVKVFQTVAGKTDSLSLPDGTRVVLGPASRLVLAAEYGTGARAVELDGEALFEVTHDEARPFTVRAGDAVIRDIGTIFAVRGEAGGAVRVSVTEGAVVLHRAGSAESTGVVLRAGDRAELDHGRLAAQRDTVADIDLAFTDGRLVFDHATLETVAVELRRWYGVDLKFDDGANLGRRINASFRNDSLAGVLQVLERKLGVTIERHGNTLFVHSDQ